MLHMRYFVFLLLALTLVLGKNVDLWVPLERIGVMVVRRDNGPYNERMTLAELKSKISDDCIIYHIHAVGDSSYLEDKIIEEYLRHQFEWSSHMRNECLFVLYPLTPADLPKVSGSFAEDASKVVSEDASKAVSKDASKLVSKDASKLVSKDAIKAVVSLEKQDVMDRYRTRYDMLLVLITAMEDGHFKTYFPWILYSDIDIIFTHPDLYAYEVMERVVKSTRYTMTSEATFCGDGNIQSCDYENMDIGSGSKSDIAAIIATDQFPFTQAVLNSGVMFFSISRVSRFILHATLSLFNLTLPQHSFDDLDQGRLSYVLQETFDLNHDYIRSLFAPLNETILRPACHDDQILLMRRFNLNRALKHPLFTELAHKIFPEGKLSQNERSRVAIVCSKWFNSPACFEPGRFALRQELTGFSCGDYIAHFYGCDKKALYASSWRNEMARLECRNKLTWATNSDGSSFSWETFLNEAEFMSHDSGVFEPLTRPWLTRVSPGSRCDSWDCVSWGLENSPRHTDKHNQYRHAGTFPELPL